MKKNNILPIFIGLSIFNFIGLIFENAESVSLEDRVKKQITIQYGDFNSYLDLKIKRIDSEISDLNSKIKPPDLKKEKHWF